MLQRRKAMTDSSQLFADVAEDARVSETPLVDKGFASVRKIGNGLYAAISDPSKGNTTVCNGGSLVGRDAALLLEGFATPAGASFQMDALRMVSQAPVKGALDTHYHIEHSTGNASYGTRGIEVWAHPAVARRIVDSYMPLQEADRPAALGDPGPQARGPARPNGRSWRPRHGGQPVVAWLRGEGAQPVGGPAAEEDPNQGFAETARGVWEMLSVVKQLSLAIFGPPRGTSLTHPFRRRLATRAGRILAASRAKHSAEPLQPFDHFGDLLRLCGAERVEERREVPPRELVAHVAADRFADEDPCPAAVRRIRLALHQPARL